MERCQTVAVRGCQLSVCDKARSPRLVSHRSRGVLPRREAAVYRYEPSAPDDDIASGCSFTCGKCSVARSVELFFRSETCASYSKDSRPVIISTTLLGAGPSPNTVAVPSSTSVMPPSCISSATTPRDCAWACMISSRVTAASSVCSSSLSAIFASPFSSQRFNSAVPPATLVVVL